MKKTINIAFNFGERVFLKTDKTTARIVTEIMLRTRNITYGLATGTDETWHQECEIEREKSNNKVTGFVK